MRTNYGSSSAFAHLMTRGVLWGLLAAVLLMVPRGAMADGPDFDLELKMVPVAGATSAGGFMPYVVQVKNHGPDTATDISLSGDTIRRGMWIGPESRMSPLVHGQPLAAGETAMLGSVNIPMAPGVQRTDCSVSTPWPERNMANNSAVVEVNVVGAGGPQGNLELVAIDVPNHGVLGSDLLYKFFLQNTGDQPVSAGYAGLFIPYCAKVVAGHAEKGVVTVTERYCHVSDIALMPGESVTLTFTVSPTSMGLMRTYAAAASELFEHDMLNNYYISDIKVLDSTATKHDYFVNLSASAEKSFKKKNGMWTIKIKGNVTYGNLAAVSGQKSQILIRYYLSDDPIASGGPDLTWYSQTIPAPTSSETPYHIELKQSFSWFSESVQKYLIAVIDSDGLHGEFWTENNYSAIYLP